MAELTGGVAGPAEPSIQDAFSWASRDPQWISKVLLMGLIGLIPIVGALQQLGWMLASLDNLRAGRYEVPPAGFRYATRGVWVFLAGLIYGFVILFVIYGTLLLLVVALGGFSQAQPQSEGGSTNQLSLLFFPLVFAYFGLVALFSLALSIFVPLVIEFTDRKGLAGAFDIPAFFRAIGTSPKETLAAAGLALVAYFISGLGSYLCYVGLIFTVPYSFTVLAGVLRWYEAKAKPGTLPAARHIG
jgi:hypothetical protein